MNKTKELYNNKYFINDDLNKKRVVMYEQEMSSINMHKSLYQGGRILDIGCGTGDFLDLFGNNWEKWGTEISKYAREIAYKKNINVINLTYLLALLFEHPETNSFDIIIFRGTIQHLDNPMYTIQKCYELLKPGGLICFLATPNSDSMVYRRCGDLPMINEKYNFLIPSTKILRQTLTNFGFKDVTFHYPYWKTPYRNTLLDLWKGTLTFLGLRRKADFAFWGNTLECYAYKEK